MHWEYLSNNESLPWSEERIERYADKWNWFDLDRQATFQLSEAFSEPYKDLKNIKGVIKIFNRWTKQEISSALETIRSAEKRFLHSAEQGNADAQCSLGIMYCLGVRVPQALEEAAKWYRLSAEQGHEEAQDELDYPT